MAYLLEDMGCLAALQGKAERAMRLVGAAETLRKAIGAPRSDAEQQKLDTGLSASRHSLGEAAAAVLLAEGERINFEEAAAYAAGNM